MILTTRRTLQSILVVTLLMLGLMSGVASAATAHTYGDVLIAQSYEIPITNPTDGLTYQSVVLVSGAHLDTRKPDYSGVTAPKGQIYLTLKWTSAPPQIPYGQPGYGNFFSQITPLPASALTFVSGKHSYGSVRINPVDQTGSSLEYDGLIQATYYFLIPISTKSGQVVIGKTTSIGTEYQNMTGGQPTVLNIGGPTSIPLTFPKLTVVSPPGAVTTPLSSKSSVLSAVIQWLILIAIGLGIFYLVRRQRKVAEPVEASVPVDTPAAAVGNPLSAPSPVAFVGQVDSATTDLQINVLGGLEFIPSLGKISDPARAFLIYLALHTDRPRSVDDAQTALYPLDSSGKDISRSSFLNYVSEARKAVGSRHLPEAGDVGGYRLQHFTSDWSQFQAYLATFEKSKDESAIAAGRAALTLVRDRALAGQISRYYEWAHTESYFSQMERSIAKVAFELSSLLIRADDLEGAEWALRKGLLVAPASKAMWEQLTDVLLEHHDQALMQRHWHAAEAELGSSGLSELKRRETGL